MNINDMVAANMAHENGLDFETASQVVAWLDNEGILDNEIAREVYSEAA